MQLRTESGEKRGESSMRGMKRRDKRKNNGQREKERRREEQKEEEDKRREERKKANEQQRRRDYYNQWEIEDIIGDRFCSQEVLVKWEGWHNQYSVWVRKEDLECKHLLSRYWKARRREKERSKGGRGNKILCHYYVIKLLPKKFVEYSLLSSLG